MRPNATCRHRNGALIALYAKEREPVDSLGIANGRKGAATSVADFHTAQRWLLFGRTGSARGYWIRGFALGRSATEVAAPLRFFAFARGYVGGAGGFIGAATFLSPTAGHSQKATSCFQWLAVGDRSRKTAAGNVAAPMEWTAFSESAIAFSSHVFIAMAQKATTLPGKAMFFDKTAMPYAQKAMPEARAAVLFMEKAVADSARAVACAEKAVSLAKKAATDFARAVLGLTKAVFLLRIAGEGSVKVESSFQGTMQIAS